MLAILFSFIYWVRYKVKNNNYVFLKLDDVEPEWLVEWIDDEFNDDSDDGYDDKKIDPDVLLDFEYFNMYAIEPVSEFLGALDLVRNEAGTLLTQG